MNDGSHGRVYGKANVFLRKIPKNLPLGVIWSCNRSIYAVFHNNPGVIFVIHLDAAH
jgi:hypothetical protein